MSVSDFPSKQHTVWSFVKKPFIILMAILITLVSLAATPSQAGVSWNYHLIGKLNTSHDDLTHLTILMTGSGSFNMSEGRIGGGGSYTILNQGGSVVGSGTWTAKWLHSFTPAAPGGSPGEGGTLELMALFDGDGTGVLNGEKHVVIQCSMWQSPMVHPGYPWPADFIEVSPYTTHLTGAVMFNLNQ